MGAEKSGRLATLVDSITEQATPGRAVQENDRPASAIAPFTYPNRAAVDSRHQTGPSRVQGTRYPTLHAVLPRLAHTQLRASCLVRWDPAPPADDRWGESQAANCRR